MSEGLPEKTTTTEIVENGPGEYTLTVLGCPVARIAKKPGMEQRQVIWQIYGPCDLDRSVAIMKGFLQLTALLGNEENLNGANDRAPNFEAPIKLRKSKNG